MQSLSAVLLFFLFSMLRSDILVESIAFYDEDDLAEFNITCGYEDCFDDGPDSLTFRSCHCGKYCIQFGTCCSDSYYAGAAQPKLKASCRSIYGSGHYFIVDRCSSTDSVWASLCNAEWDGDDDLQKIVPVTSIFSTISYKNYYCFRCHETTDEFRYWAVRFLGNAEQYNISNDEHEPAFGVEGNVSYIYNKELSTWMASYGGNTNYFPVQSSVTPSDDIDIMTHRCIPDVISDCSDEWFDEEVRDKCHSYMAIKELSEFPRFLLYKNIHCALCNFESLNFISCRVFNDSSTFFDTLPFSFTYLLDINPSDGEPVGIAQKCSEDYLWDPYTLECRKLACAVPGYKVKSGKCVSE